MAELRQNIWNLEQWYDQAVAGDVSYQGAAELWMFGRNWEYGLTNSPAFLPNNPTSWRSSPVQLTGSWASGMGNQDGASAAVGIKADNSIWVWGKSAPKASLGLNQPNNTTASSPKQLFGTSDSTSYVHTNQQMYLARHDENLFAWGNGNYGQLGAPGIDGPSDWRQRSSPCQIPGVWSENFSTNGDAVLAVKTDGTLWAWGRNEVGNLGLNTGNPTLKISSPTQVGTDSNWSTTLNQCNMGKMNGTAQAGCIKTDGTLWVWGWNGDAGVLGLSQSGPQRQRISSPAQLPGTTWKTINGGGSTIALSVKTDGTLWAWGDNQYGRLGLNQAGNMWSAYSFSSPKQVGTDTNWYAAWSQGKGTWGTKTDGTLWVWGHNNPQARLGLNTTTNMSSPTQIPGTDWKKEWQVMRWYRSMLFKEI